MKQDKRFVPQNMKIHQLDGDIFNRVLEKRTLDFFEMKFLIFVSTVINKEEFRVDDNLKELYIKDFNLPELNELWIATENVLTQENDNLNKSNPLIRLVKYISYSFRKFLSRI